MNVIFSVKNKSDGKFPLTDDLSLTTGSFVNGEQQVMHPALIIGYQSAQLYYVMTNFIIKC